MKKRTKGRLRRAAAILLSVVLIVEMMSNAGFSDVLAKENGISPEQAKAQEDAVAADMKENAVTEENTGEPETAEKPAEETGENPDTEETGRNPESEETGENPDTEKKPTAGEEDENPATQETAAVSPPQAALNVASAVSGKRDVTFTLKIYGYDEAYPLPDDMSRVSVIKAGGAVVSAEVENQAVGAQQGEYALWQYLFKELEEGTGYGVKVEGAPGQIGEFATTGTEFEKILYAVRFYDGNELKNVIYVNAGGKAWEEQAPALTREGSAFAGWVTADGGSEAFDFNTAIAQVTDVYASWAAPAVQADNIASGDGWVLAGDGTLTIESNDGMSNWTSKRPFHKDKVTSVEIQNGVTGIGDLAFNGCSNLTEITIPETVTSIGSQSLAYCGLTEITIPETVTSIKAYAFNNCKGLTSVVLPDNLTSIENSVFQQCTGLKSITIPESVESIGDIAFFECTGLTEITIPETVTSIGERAFFQCSALTSITIPKNVTSIGANAFNACDELAEVIMNGETPPTLSGNQTFLNCGFWKKSAKGIHVPEGKAEAYKTAWTDWARYIADDATPAEKHEHDGVAFTAWTATDSLPTAPGNYYLTKDVTLNGTWKVPSGETSLCLNGKTIRAQGAYRVITIGASNTLNLYDCTDSGMITGGQQGGVIINKTGIFRMYGGRIRENNTLTNYGAGIYSSGTFYLYDGEISNNTTAYACGGVSNQGTFYMYGGKIADNTAEEYCGGVENGYECTFYMYGGEITGNRAKIHGGVVNQTKGNSYLYGGVISKNSITDTDKTGAGVRHQGGSLIVGGDIVIKDNTNGNGENSNLSIQVNRKINIDSNNPLTAGAYIGITSETVPTENYTHNITGVNNADYSKYFYSDNSAYVIVDSADHKVQLALPHTHTLTLTSAKSATCTQAGNTAYYVCSGKNGCGKWFSDDKGTNEITDKNSVVIAASGHSYDTSTWGYQGADGHARKCRNCNEHDKISAHMPGAAATETTPQTCTVCGYVIQPALGHTCKPQSVGRVEADCTTAGKEAYYHCAGCGKDYEDAAATKPIADISTWGNIAALGHDYGAWTEIKPATETTPGQKEHTCIRCGDKETEDIPALGTPSGPVDPDDKPTVVPGTGDNDQTADPGTGNDDQSDAFSDRGVGIVDKDVQTDGSAPATQLATPVEELADMLLTPEEKGQLASGTDIRIVLDVKAADDSVSSEDKAFAEAALGSPAAEGYAIGQYLDIGLFKVIGDSRSAILETNRKIAVVIAVPESLKNMDGNATRTFAVLRVHNGVAELLADLDDSGDTITIATDRFSTYVIVYKDTAGDEAAVNDDDRHNANPVSQKDDEPKTGDGTPIELYATLAMISGLGYLMLYFKDAGAGMTEERKKALVAGLVRWAKRGGRLRRLLALAIIFVVLVYYHGIAKKKCTEWKEAYGE